MVFDRIRRLNMDCTCKQRSLDFIEEYLIKIINQINDQIVELSEMWLDNSLV